MFDLSSLNPFAVGVAALVGVVLGAAWYAPPLLGNAWMQALGKPQEELGSPAASIGGSALSCLVAATAVALLVQAVGARGAAAGAGVGALLGLGIVAMTMLSDSLFSGWGWRLYFIQMGYRAAYLVLMGAICGGWPA